jgi:hypothetical protein
MNNSVKSAEQLQWIKGDKIGNPETIDSQDNVWTVFKSGSRIATDLIDEFMITVSGELLDFTGSNQTEVPHIISQKEIKDNPIKTLFAKQKKTDEVNLNLNFSIKIPTADIFNIISMTFDSDEVLLELDSFISNQIDKEILKKALRDSIEQLIIDKFKTA